MPHEIIFSEQYGTFGEKRVYVKPPGIFFTFVLDIRIEEEKCQAWQFKLYPFLSFFWHNERVKRTRDCFVIGLFQFEVGAGCPEFLRAKPKSMLKSATTFLSLTVSLLFSFNDKDMARL
jgi:hypothetical protein